MKKDKKDKIVVLINGQATEKMYIPILDYNYPRSYFTSMFYQLGVTIDREWINPKLIKERDRQQTIINWLKITDYLNTITINYSSNYRENIKVKISGKWLYSKNRFVRFPITVPRLYEKGLNYLNPEKPDKSFSEVLFYLISYYMKEYNEELGNIKGLEATFSNYRNNDTLTTFSIFFMEKPEPMERFKNMIRN